MGASTSARNNPDTIADINPGSNDSIGGVPYSPASWNGEEFSSNRQPVQFQAVCSTIDALIALRRHTETAANKGKRVVTVSLDIANTFSICSCVREALHFHRLPKKDCGNLLRWQRGCLRSRYDLLGFTGVGPRTTAVQPVVRLGSSKDTAALDECDVLCKWRLNHCPGQQFRRFQSHCTGEGIASHR